MSCSPSRNRRTSFRLTWFFLALVHEYAANRMHVAATGDEIIFFGSLSRYNLSADLLTNLGFDLLSEIDHENEGAYFQYDIIIYIRIIGTILFRPHSFVDPSYFGSRISFIPYSLLPRYYHLVYLKGAMVVY